MTNHGRFIQMPTLLSLLTVLVTAAPVSSTVTLSSSANPLVLGKPLTLTATVAPASGTGEVTFYDGVVPIGVAALSDGGAKVTTLALAPGTHSVRAYYHGDSATQPSTSPSTSQTIVALGENGFQKPASYAAPQFGPFGLAVGDFNEDGVLDLVVANFGLNTVGVMLGNGDGTFKAAADFQVASALGSFPSGTLVSDFNGDGHLDIAVVNASTSVNTVAILLGNGDGTFKPVASYPVPGNPHSLALCDFNEDGVGDLVTDNFGFSSISVLIGKPDGTLQDADNIMVGVNPLGLTCGDLDGDGHADIAVLNGAGLNVLLGNGDGTFKPLINYPNAKGNSVAIGDFNRDGLADTVVLGASGAIVMLGKSDGTLQAGVTYPVGGGPFQVIVGDFNGDGLEDLAVSNTSDNTVSVLLGKGDGTFQSQMTYAAGTGPRPVVAGDFLENGRSDLAIGDFFGGTISVLLGVPVDEPTITAVVNGASFQSTGLSPGVIFTVAGTGLGPPIGQTLQFDSSGNIASTLAGVQVLVDDTPAPLLFVQGNQINAVAPYELTSRVGQSVNVQVIYNQVAGNIAEVPIVATSPAIFNLGSGQGAIRNQDQTVNGTSNPAAAGSLVSIYATGEGQINPNGVDGQLVTNASTLPVAAVSVSIGAVSIVPQFAGSTEFDGFFQVNAQVPPGIQGVVPVVVTVGGKSSPTGITMAVQ
jgi:uncharacterized protein (TIGR03437 family)